MLSALKLRRADQESRQQLILSFKGVRCLLLSGWVWRGRMSRRHDRWSWLGIALGGLRLCVLGLRVLGSLRRELGLLTKLVKQGFSRFLAEAAGYELRFKALFF